MRRFWASLAIAMCGIGGTIGYIAVSSSSDASAANLFVNVTAGTCTRSASQITFEQAQTNGWLCGSIQSAVAACTAGDLIRMKVGSYADQVVTATKSSPGCVVDAEDGTNIGDLDTIGAFYELKDMDATSWSSTDDMTNITLRNVEISGNGGIYLDTNSQDEQFTNVSWIGGSFHDFACSGCPAGMAIYTSANAGGGPGGSKITNFVIEDVDFFNIANTGGVGNHFEVVRVDGVIDGFTCRKCTFGAGNVTSTSIIFFSTFRSSIATAGVDKPINVTLENTFFGDTGDAFFTLSHNYGGKSCDNQTFTYNTFLAAPFAGGNCTYTNVVWTGNLAPAGNGCQGTTFTDNVWYGSGSTCHASDLVITNSGLGGTDGFYLQSGSGAIDNGGSGGNCISEDHDAGPRPVGAQCDAGADERD